MSAHMYLLHTYVHGHTSNFITDVPQAFSSERKYTFLKTFLNSLINHT